MKPEHVDEDLVLVSPCPYCRGTPPCTVCHNSGFASFGDELEFATQAMRERKP